MDAKELKELYDRILKLSDSDQIFILAGLYGTISALAQNGDENAVYAIGEVENKVSWMEARISEE